MASTINATPTSSGLISSADNSGVLALQTGGTTAVTIDGSQNVTLNNVIPSGSTAPTNGMFLPAANTIGLSTASTERMRIDSSGNVGIGTSSPSRKLEITGSTDVNSFLQVNSSLTTAQSIFGVTSSNVGFIGAITNNDFTFRTNNTERMRIDSSGNLVVGGTIARALVNSQANAYGGFTSYDASNLNTGNNNTKYSEYGFSGFDTVGTWKPTAYIQTGPSDANYVSSYMAFKTRTSDIIFEAMRIDASGGLILAGSTAQKATGTTWSNPSDQRLKDNIRDYDKGLSELMQVRVREWEYNGKGGTVEGTKGLGVVADEIMVVLPNTVENYEAKLNADDEKVTAIKKFDATEITWLLVKTIQEQQALINDLTTRLVALENT